MSSINLHHSSTSSHHASRTRYSSLMPTPQPRETPSPRPLPTLLPSALPRDITASGGPSSTTKSQLILPPPSISHLPSPDHPFVPFFTLIEDSTTSAHHHPTVHYIFSDDETDAVTAAALQIGDSRTSSAVPSSTNAGAGVGGDATSDRNTQNNRNGRNSSLHRYLLLELSPDGRSVESAHSMTPDWQVLNAEVTPAPMLEGGEEGETGGLMLKIEGTEGVSLQSTAEESEVGMEGLVEIFKGRMEELRRVVEKG